ncbi:MAG TPA: GTP cyclohydrolase II [Myxococcales bacterium]|jgi:GTP cyclohydrolase II
MDTHQRDSSSKTPGISRTLEVYAETDLPTGRGEFRTVVFRERKTGVEHLALVMGEVKGQEGVAVRVHSECLTSEVFGSLKCDCKAQLDHALDIVSRGERGVVLYLRQEGRGIGLGNKIRAYALQAQGHDTYEANRLLGFADDLRHYDVAAEMLRLLGVCSVDLITNNPMKIAALVDEGIPVRRRIPSIAPVNKVNEAYLRVKVERSGHMIDLPASVADEADKRTG